jgi:hypothetical protein
MSFLASLLRARDPRGFGVKSYGRCGDRAAKSKEA